MNENFITRDELDMKINVAKAIGALAALRTLTSVAIFVSLGAFSVMVGGYFSLANKIDEVHADLNTLRVGQEALKADVAALQAGQDSLKIEVADLQKGQAEIVSVLRQANLMESSSQ